MKPSINGFSSRLGGVNKNQDDINRQALSTEHLMTGLKGKAIRSGFVNVASQVGNLVLQLVSSAILARLLAPAEFGTMAMATTAIALANTVTDLGLAAPTVQRGSITQEQVSSLFFVNVIGGFVIFLLACASAPLFALIFQTPGVTFLIICLAFSIPMTAVTVQFNAIMSRNMRWLELQIINLTSQFCSALAAIILAWKAGWGVYALVVFGIGSSLITLILTIAVCPWRPSLHLDFKSIRSELFMGLDMTLFRLVNYAHRQVDNVIIGARWGAVELGFYSRGYNILSQAEFALSGPVGNALIPGLSRVAHDRDRWRHRFLEAAPLLAYCSGAIFVLISACSTQLIAILYGPQWSQVTPIVNYLAIAGLATSVCSPFGWAFVSLDRTRPQLHWIMLSSPIVLIAFWIGSYHGGVGVALAYAITKVVINFGYIYFALKGTPVSYWDGVGIKLPIYAAFAVAVYVARSTAYHFADWGLFAQLVGNAAVAGSVYLVSIFIASLIVPTLAPSRHVIRKLIFR